MREVVRMGGFPQFCLLFFLSLDLSNENSKARNEVTVIHGWTSFGSDEPSLVKIIEGQVRNYTRTKRLTDQIFSCKDLVVVMVLVTADGIRVENEHSGQQGFH